MRHMVEEGEFDSAFEAMEGLVNEFVKLSKVDEAKKVVEKMKKRLRGGAVDSRGEGQD